MTLERIEHKVFASEAPLEEMGQFGSALATTKLNTKDVAEIQALPAYAKGWGSAIISENNYPAMEEMNGVLNVMSYHTGYLYQEGIPTYSATQEYSATSWVKDLAGEKIYKSLQGGNKGHDLTDPAWWEELKLGGGGLEIGDIGFTQMAIDESKGKRRKLNGQLIIQDQYQELTNIIKNSVALNPDLTCTEDEWQTSVTMSAYGLCYKFVIDDEAGTIRLPKYPNYFIAGLANIAPVAGNGMTLGLTTDGSNYQTLAHKSNYALIPSQSGYTKLPATAGTEVGYNNALYGITKDATKSGIEAQIKKEQIKGQYFIQVATGVEVEDNIINEIELNNPFSLLDYKYSEYELNNNSWLRSNGQWNSKAIYPAVYDLLLKIYNGTETKAGVSVKLSTGSYTDYDFVLNTSSETFRLPIKVKQKYLNAINGNMPVVGNGMTLGLTNGTDLAGLANVSTSPYHTDVRTTMYGTSVGSTLATGNLTKQGGLGVTTDASKSGIVAKVSQSEVSGLYLYFYVGETVQNANLINAGRALEILPDKLDKKQLYNKITNCLLEVPQNIKLELNNGTLTLKAGSKVIVPNGTGIFNEVTIANDISVSPNDGEKMFFLHPDGTQIYHANISNQIYSGTTQPSITYGFWYDTTNNVVKFTGNGSTWLSGFSLPLAKGANSSIDQVFNGMGYIGSTAWVDKGVKGLIPNGRNENGSLNNIEFTTSKIVTYTNPSNYTFSNYGWVMTPDLNIIPYDLTMYKYNEQENCNYELYNVRKQFSTLLASCSVNGGVISNFQPKQPFVAVDYNDYKNNPHITQTYVNGTSGYVVYSNKLGIQWGRSVHPSGGKSTVTFLKPFANANAMVTCSGLNTGFNNSDFGHVTAITATTASFASANGAEVTWFAIGYIA